MTTMSDEEESEIKIEYFESYDVDPLCEFKQKVGKDLQNITLINTISVEIIGAENVSENIIINKENEPINSENNFDWHKNVDNSGKYLCKSCDLSYSTIQTLRNHIRKKHTSDYEEMKNQRFNSLRKRKLKCHICKLKFTDMRDLQKHISAHGTNDIQKSCQICLAIFEEEASMLSHMSNEHNLIKNKLNFCSICGYRTSKLSHFKQHEKTHINNNKKKCLYCDYRTNYSSNLKIHEQIHSSIRPYICDYVGCDYSCAAKSGLNSHRLKHDKHKNILYCDKCNYKTGYKNSLKKHIDSHTRSSVRKQYFN